jgi:hypothetical protein
VGREFLCSLPDSRRSWKWVSKFSSCPLFLVGFECRPAFFKSLVRMLEGLDAMALEVLVAFLEIFFGHPEVIHGRANLRMTFPSRSSPSSLFLARWSSRCPTRSR